MIYVFIFFITDVSKRSIGLSVFLVLLIICGALLASYMSSTSTPVNLAIIAPKEQEIHGRQQANVAANRQQSTAKQPQADVAADVLRATRRQLGLSNTSDFAIEAQHGRGDYSRISLVKQYFPRVRNGDRDVV